MTQLPTPAQVDQTFRALAASNPIMQEAIDAVDRSRATQLSPLTNDVVARVIVHPTHWPDCLRCGQSMTGCYAGIARCNRCSSARRLNG